jgi:hypothetical protein
MLAIPVGVINFLFAPGPIVAFAWLDNPLGVPGFPSAIGGAVAYVAMLILLLAGVAAMVKRFRFGGPVQRAQVKWVAAASVLLLVTEVGNVATFDPADPYAQPWWILAASASLALVPIAIGIAILRYRLYEIDRIISRTIGWAILTGVLIFVFMGVVLGLQGLFAPVTAGDTLAVATSTLLTAALFAPLRGRVQRAVDRRFNRGRVHAERMIDDFGNQLRDEVDLGRLHGLTLGTAVAAVEPDRAAMWLRGIQRSDH